MSQETVKNGLLESSHGRRLLVMGAGVFSAAAKGHPPIVLVEDGLREKTYATMGEGECGQSATPTVGQLHSPPQRFFFTWD